MSKKLIVNADDFGRTHKVSEGIIKAHLDGIVSSATVMMNMPHVAQDIRRALEEAPKLGLGVHLVFTTGRPLLPTEWVASLVDEHGSFLSRDVASSDPRRIQLDELRSELKTQVKGFENIAKRPPDHIDGHHFVYMHPYVFEVYHDLALELGVPMRIPFPREEIDPSDPLYPSTLRVHGVPDESWMELDRERLAMKPVRGPDHFLPSFFGENVTIEHVLNVLDMLPDGVSELMTHPGYNDDELQSGSSYNVQRETELAVLTDARVKQKIADARIELVTFADV